MIVLGGEERQNNLKKNREGEGEEGVWEEMGKLHGDVYRGVEGTWNYEWMKNDKWGRGKLTFSGK